MPVSFAFARVAIAAAIAILISLKKRRKPSDNHTPVPAFRLLRRNKQKLFTVSLRYKVFARYAELLRQSIRDSLSPAIRQAQIILVRSDRVGVTFDEEDLARITVRNVAHCGGDGFEHDGLLRAEFPGAELEVDGIDADAPHTLAKAHARKNFIERVDAIKRLDGRRLERAVDVVFRSDARIDDIFFPRNVDVRRRQRNDQGAQRYQSYASSNRPVFEQHEPAAVGEDANAPHRTAVSIDLDFKARTVRTDDVRDCISVRRALGLRGPAVETEALSLVMPDERLIVRLEDSPVAGLLDDLVSAWVYDFVPLRADDAKTLILQPQALIDCGLAVLVRGHLPLLCDQPIPVEPMGFTLGLSFLLLGGEFMVKRGLLLVGLLLLKGRLLLFLVQLLLGMLLLLLQLVHLGLLVAQPLILKGLPVSVLLLQQLLLLSFLKLKRFFALLLCLFLLLLLLRLLLLLQALLILDVVLLMLLVLTMLGLAVLLLLLLLLPVLLLLQLPFPLLFFFLLRRLLHKNDLRFGSAYCSRRYNPWSYSCQKKRHDLDG